MTPTHGPVWRRLTRFVDWPNLLLALAIATVGLVNLYSATRHVPQRDLFSQQVVWMLVGLVGFVLASIIDYRFWIRMAWIILGIGVAGVIAVHFGGVVVNGSRRWLDFGFLRIQPSEFVKLAVILALARFVHDRGGGEQLDWTAVGTRAAAIAVAIAFIAWQPDLGTATLVALMALSVAFMSARILWPLLAGLAAGAAAIPLLWAYLHDYQKQRILTFLDPSRDPSGAGWHARQSIFAVGSGRLSGKGFMAGTQNQLNFLPEQWTDFPFSVFAEEWGFAGSVLLLTLYVFLILWIINVATQCRDRFGATLCLGVGAMLFWQVIVNIAMVTGLAPVVGVTLPLVSYGGSSVVTVFLGLGLVASVSIRRYMH
jgi:rod shape determining protein RodA